MKVFLCMVLAVACFAPPSIAIDCGNNRCSRSGRRQTLCKYPNSSPAPSCGQVLVVGLTDAERKGIVNLHNFLRLYVAAGKETRGNPGPQPAARNMQTMSWDSELEQVAQRWANQCSFGHDECRDVERYGVGQNVAQTSTTGQQNSKPTDLVMMWYNEVKDFDRNEVNRLTTNNFSKVGHYTQLVWANSNKIGCGKIIFKSGQWNNFYLVCNYGPTGNYIGQPLYERA
ncbi:venom allergen 3-like [Nomia melanderi]|uniref:venom allergen 3-like n=1 Tax=Nomia melanderi TaxID=2448451 RepID=UPI003FCD5313